MKLITPYSSRKSWIAIADDTDESDLVRRIKSSDIILSDLDKTDAYPGKEIVFDFFTDTKHTTDRKVWTWMIAMGYFAYKEGRNSLNDIVASFTNCFLRDYDELMRIEKKHTPEYAATRFSQGVLDFYAELPNALKIYITRNVYQAAKGYAKAAGFNYVMPEQFNKKKAVDEINKKYPDKKRYLIRGDSLEDEQMAERCRELKQQRTINDVVYINVAGSYRRINPTADANTSRNQTALAAWVKGNIY